MINGLVGQSAVLDWFMVRVSEEVNLIVPAVLAFGYWLWKDWKRACVAVVCIALVITAGDVLGEYLKEIFARMRPCKLYDFVRNVGGCGPSFGMPSNHALNSAAAAAFFQVMLPRTGWISWPVVAVIGFSRVYTGSHYVTDVLVGWAIGAVLGLTAAYLLHRLSVGRGWAIRG